MTQLSLSVPDDLGEWAAARAAEAQMGDAGAYLADLLRRDRDHAERLARLQAAIDEGLASPEVETTIDDIIADGRRNRATR